MDYYTRSVHQSGSWFGAEHLADSSLLNSVPIWTFPSVSSYPSVSDGNYSTVLHQRESGNWCTVPQEVGRVTPCLMPSVPQKEMENLRFLGNFSLQPSLVKRHQVVPTRLAAVARKSQKESLTFVGNFTHSPDFTQDQLIALLNSAKTPVSGCASSHGVSFAEKAPLNPSLPLSSHGGIVMPSLPSSTPQKGQGLRPVTDTAALLNVVGPVLSAGANFSLPAVVFPDQQAAKRKPDRMPNTGYTAFGVPTDPRGSAMHYTREEYVRMLEYHHHMASYYKELKQKAELTQKMEASVCPDQLQSRRGGELGGEGLEEPPQKNWDDGTGGIVLPDDAIEKLDAISGIWDLAVEMGFLTVCKADA